MALKKKYSKDKTACKVTFTLPKEIAEQFDEVALVGDFNNWDHKANLFTKKKNNITLELDAGKEYQFRYCGGEEVWLNESDADKQVLNPFGDSENSVIVL